MLAMLRDWQRHAIHSLRDEVRFPSRPGFTFNDFKCAEAIAVEELAGLRQFVENSCAAMSIEEQLHTIWSAPYVIACEPV
jgi:hypothetical protein